MNKMCTYDGKQSSVTVYGPFWEPIRCKIIKCSECGRKLRQRVSHCGCGFDDACYVIYCLPPHKVKGWFKKKNKKQSKDLGVNR